MGPHDGPPVDEITPASSSSYAAPVVAVVAVLLAVVVAFAVAGRPAHHPVSRPAPTPTPIAPTAPATSPVASIGSVLTDAVAGCVRTDHSSRIDVAMSLTNLTNVPLRVVSAASVSDGLEVTRLWVGTGPCGLIRTAATDRLAPGRDLVVGLRFAVGSPCPPYGEVLARLTIDAGGHAVHASTPSLANLRVLRFPGC